MGAPAVGELGVVRDKGREAGVGGPAGVLGQVGRGSSLLAGLPAGWEWRIPAPISCFPGADISARMTGVGTGLGLSISYDIVVQMHKGDIRVRSEEDQFTEFAVILPKGGAA